MVDIRVAPFAMRHFNLVAFTHTFSYVQSSVFMAVYYPQCVKFLKKLISEVLFLVASHYVVLP